MQFVLGFLWNVFWTNIIYITYVQQGDYNTGPGERRYGPDYGNALAVSKPWKR